MMYGEVIIRRTVTRAYIEPPCLWEFVFHLNIALLTCVTKAEATQEYVVLQTRSLNYLAGTNQTPMITRCRITLPVSSTGAPTYKTQAASPTTPATTAGTLTASAALVNSGSFDEYEPVP
jgi:hypothetical protein